MTNNENQYTIYIRSTKESIPVSKEEFDAYYHDITSSGAVRPTTLKERNTARTQRLSRRKR